MNLPIHAIVHTVGVSLQGEYCVLELAYTDVLQHQTHFLINCPVSFPRGRRENIFYSMPDAIVTRRGGVPQSHVFKFLKERYNVLVQALAGHPVIFGYKGIANQPQVLIDAGIPNIVNLETYGLRSVEEFKQYVEKPKCNNHKGAQSKCALYMIELIKFGLSATSVQNEPVLPVANEEPLHQGE